MMEVAGDTWGPTRSPLQGRGRSAAGTPEVGAACIFAYCLSHVSAAGDGVCPAHPMGTEKIKAGLANTPVKL